MIVNITKSSREPIQLDYTYYVKSHKYTVLYFYPKDSTPWCTREANDFRDYKKDFENLDCQIIWVSKDNHDSHCKFMEKFGLDFDLISDESLDLHKMFDVWWKKKFMWKEYMWTIRSTFLLDNDAKIIKTYKDISVSDHAKTVLDDLKSIIW